MDAITRDLKFFNDKLDQVDKTIYSSDFDNQFNLISNYLNTKLKAEIDALISGAAQGILGSEGAFLENVGDGTTRWQMMNNNAIEDYSITLNKIVKAAAGSVLCGNNAGNITPVTAGASDRVLVSGYPNIPTWNKLTDINIIPASITGTQLGEIAPENFQNNVFTHNVIDNSIQTQHILDNNITNAKIMNGVVDYKHIGVFYGLVLNQNTKDNIHVEHFADGSMPVEKFLDGSIEFSKSFYEPLSYYPYRQFTPSPILARHVANGSITDAHLVPYNPQQEAWFCVGGIDQANWKFGEKLTGDKIMPDKLSKGWFTPDVQQAMTNLGG
ncbi:MAG: hypothetical protein EKK56_07935 [Flavobacteriaceae bacterium]|nr:MAG: hypothetical protein EKK56_07935 [Flavobacteriaceae bacterium]